MNWLKTFYLQHIQKTVGSILGTFAVGDFVTALAGYHDEIASLFGNGRHGEVVYASIRIAGAAVIVYRSTHKPQSGV